MLQDSTIVQFLIKNSVLGIFHGRGGFGLDIYSANHLHSVWSVTCLNLYVGNKDFGARI